jgi:predicted regulator of Ras-like GTPase activity (Roadblock/LC7/MglB family)
VDAQAALDELTTLSVQVVEAVIVGADGAVAATTAAGNVRAEALARAGTALLAAAADVRAGDQDIEHVEISLREGAVFAVRDGDRTIVATTVAEPTAGLVLYDLRTALRRSAAAPPERKRRTRTKRDTTETNAGA